MILTILLLFSWIQLCYTSSYRCECEITNATQYNISVPEMECSATYSTDFNVSKNVSQTLVGGTTCFFKTPVLFSLLLTVQGRTSIKANTSSGISNYYGGCTGSIYINVTKPTPKPDPDPTPTPTPNPATQSQINQLTKTLTIIGIINIVLIFLTLIFLVITRCKKSKRSNFHPVPQSNGYARQN